MFVLCGLLVGILGLLYLLFIWTGKIQQNSNPSKLYYYARRVTILENPLQRTYCLNTIPLPLTLKLHSTHGSYSTLTQHKLGLLIFYISTVLCVLSSLVSEYTY